MGTNEFAEISRKIVSLCRVDVGIDPYANLGTFRIAAQNRRTHAYYTHVFHKCHVKSVEAKGDWYFRLRKNRAPAGSQSAGARFFMAGLTQGERKRS